jgi:DNA-binding NarL/FixJ family response regulator
MPVSQGAKKRVFIVDDHPLVREWLANLVNQQSDLMICGEADSARHAVPAVAACLPDVVVVDISLADSSGIALIKEIKQVLPNVWVLVLSMHEESHYATRALRAGATGYLVKREATGKVMAAIRSVLAGKLVLSDSLAAVRPGHETQDHATITQSLVEELSDRELEVFELLGTGMGTRRVAETLGLSIKTVQTHCNAVKETLHLDSGHELIIEAVRWHESRQPQ